MALSRASLTIIVPLHDEAPGVPVLARELRTFVAAAGAQRTIDLVLVDDGSTDGTHPLLVEHFEGMTCQILRHPTNRGLSAALSTGSSAARGDLIGWLDSDLTYAPAVLVELAAAVDAGADVAVASCYHPDGVVEGVAGWRRLLSGVASRVYRLLTGSPIHTFTCMVRVYRRAVLEACPPTNASFLGVTEVLLAALQRGYRVTEVPATLSRRRLGQSKMRVLTVGMSHLGAFARLLLRRRF